MLFLYCRAVYVGVGGRGAGVVNLLGNASEDKKLCAWACVSFGNVRRTKSLARLHLFPPDDLV